MEKIQFDNGVREYRINGKGILRFNPSDPNIYARFQEMGEKLSTLTTDTDADPMVQLQQADMQLKQLLGWVFGEANDFEKLLGGVSLLAVADNGKRVIFNLLAAMEPILEEGARQYADGLTQQAVAAAEKRRQQC